jgi:hypothetical protein
MNTPVPPAGKRLNREAHLRWVAIPDMRIKPEVQRALSQSRVDKLIAECDLERLGNPTVNHRDEVFWVLDGQHRIEMLKGIGYGDQQVQCWCYEGLTDEEMGEAFLKLNDAMPVSAFSKFRIGVKAGRTEESDIDHIVRACHLRVSQNRDAAGAIKAVGTLRRVYRRGVLAQTLIIIRDAYGDPGLEAEVIDGIGLLLARYEGQLENRVIIRRLADVHGGLNGLMNRARKLREQTGIAPAQCVAASAVEIINRQAGGSRAKRLDPWF